MLRLCAAIMQWSHSAKLLRQQANSNNSITFCPTAVSCVRISWREKLHSGKCPHTYSTLLEIVLGVNLRIQLEVEWMSCLGRWWRQPASSPAGKTGCWAFEPSLQTPPSPWWSGGGLPVGSSRGRDTWCTHRAQRVHSNDTAQRDRKIYTGREESRRERNTALKGMKVKVWGRDVEIVIIKAWWWGRGGREEGSHSGGRKCR